MDSSNQFARAQHEEAFENLLKKKERVEENSERKCLRKRKELDFVHFGVAVSKRSKMTTLEIELPGVKKKDISLKMTDDGFSLRAPKEDMEYVGAWTWCCPVDSSKATAKYDNGLLRIEAPMKLGLPPTEVKID